jgi:hypothetical protein
LQLFLPPHQAGQAAVTYSPGICIYWFLHVHHLDGDFWCCSKCMQSVERTLDAPELVDDD